MASSSQSSPARFRPSSPASESDEDVKEERRHSGPLEKDGCTRSCAARPSILCSPPAAAAAGEASPAVLVFLLALLLPASSAAGSAGCRRLVFILAGQSNMSGRGGATNGTWDGVVPPECAPSPRILRLSPDLRWEEAREPLHAGIDVGNVLGVGPGMPFAHAVLASSRSRGADVELVPCAQGATPLANWTRGTELYERMVTRTRAALAEGGELAAMLWFQGETDAMNREDAELYQSRMEDLVRPTEARLPSSPGRPHPAEARLPNSPPRLALGGDRGEAEPLDLAAGAGIPVPSAADFRAVEGEGGVPVPVPVDLDDDLRVVAVAQHGPRVKRRLAASQDR